MSDAISSSPVLRQRLYAIGALGLIALCAIALQPPIAQDLAYHHFADTRTGLGTPNVWNVWSNLPFLIFGCMGLWRLRAPVLPGVLPPLRIPYHIFFIGSA